MRETPWDVNAFDQWGVELGKKLADGVAPAIAEPAARAALRPQLAGLLAIADRWRH